MRVNSVLMDVEVEDDREALTAAGERFLAMSSDDEDDMPELGFTLPETGDGTTALLGRRGASGVFNADGGDEFMDEGDDNVRDDDENEEEDIADLMEMPEKEVIEDYIGNTRAGWDDLAIPRIRALVDRIHASRGHASERGGHLFMFFAEQPPLAGHEDTTQPSFYALVNCCEFNSRPKFHMLARVVCDSVMRGQCGELSEEDISAVIGVYTKRRPANPEPSTNDNLAVIKALCETLARVLITLKIPFSLVTNTGKSSTAPKVYTYGYSFNYPAINMLHAIAANTHASRIPAYLQGTGRQTAGYSEAHDPLYQTIASLLSITD